MSDGTDLNCKRAFKLYNKVGATEREKSAAINYVEKTDLDCLDVYGKFLRAEIIFWKNVSTAAEREEAYETFQKIILDKTVPSTILTGACFFAARCCELGFGTSPNLELALAHYRLANQLNPKACIKDIARLNKLLTDEPVKTRNATPARFRYDNSYATDYRAEDRVKRADNIHTPLQEGLNNLKRTGFFYADDPDEVNVDDDLYVTEEKYRNPK